MTTSVLIKKISKSYNGESVVNVDSLEIKSGEIFGLLGPNGAGKSTTLRILCGLTPPDQGEIYIHGLKLPTQIREIKKKIGIVPQEDSLDEELSVSENLAVTCQLFGIRKSEINPTVVDILRLIRLEEKANSSIQNLSGGMKRRLSIGRSLINNPDLLIMDEPTTGLDSQSRLWIWNFLRELKSEGKTVILTTHYMEEAESLCDRAALMFKGSILLLDEPKVLISKHVGRETIEVTVKPTEIAYYLNRLNSEKIEAFSMGNELHIYSNSAETTQKVFQLVDGIRKQIRPASLNDVFLKSTGFDLIEGRV